MEFDTEEVVYIFYNSYACEVAFRVKINIGHRGNDGEKIIRIFCCSCDGYHGRDKDADNKNSRTQIRFDCLETMKVNCHLTRKYCVTKFITEHIHETTTLIRVICLYLKEARNMLSHLYLAHVLKCIKET